MKKIKKDKKVEKLFGYLQNEFLPVSPQNHCWRDSDAVDNISEISM